MDNAFAWSLDGYFVGTPSVLTMDERLGIARYVMRCTMNGPDQAQVALIAKLGYDPESARYEGTVPTAPAPDLFA